MDNIVGMTADAFYKWCVEHGACDGGLSAIRGRDPADWWDETQHGDWMEWLVNMGPLKLSDAQREEYQRVEAAAWAEYQRVEAAAWAEYERVKAKAMRRIIGNPFRGVK